MVVGFLATTVPAFAADKEKVLHTFGSADGDAPYRGNLIFDQAGNLYGTTTFGGVDGQGTVFKLTPDFNGMWSETVLYSFCARGYPCADGAEPYGGLVFDVAGNLYGTTYVGGTQTRGTAFELMPGKDGKWTETVLHSFGYGGGFDALDPQAGLAIDSTGNLYGTTPIGGTNWYECGAGSCGTLFQLKRGQNGQWTETVLHNFNDDGNDGFWPYGSLTLDTSGNLYGTTFSGGVSDAGTVFELTPGTNGQWTETILHSFDVSDGYNPVSNVIFDSAGNLYGTAKEGSELCHPPPRGCGAVFELIPGTNGKWTEKVLRSFYRGRFPLGGVIFDSAGNLYGTTEVGGRYKSGDCYEGGCGGTAFELSPGIDGKWTETTLHSFGKSGDGFTPTGSLIFDATGTEFRL